MNLADAYADSPPHEVVEILGGSLPARWGRMDTLCRALAVHVGILLGEKAGELQGMECGLVCGTRLGSLHTDLAFADTLSEGVMRASPLLFSHTLPNMAPAESAVIFGLTGPVYALYDDRPFDAACRAADLWLRSGDYDGAIMAGSFDYTDKAPHVRLELFL
jgi:3-oxoacyl-(acyl-carrier-protein) synthase